jgi:hypothetical protein
VCYIKCYIISFSFHFKGENSFKTMHDDATQDNSAKDGPKPG